MGFNSGFKGLNAFTAIECTDKIQRRGKYYDWVSGCIYFSPSYLLVTRVGFNMSFLIGLLSPFSLLAFRKIGGFWGRHAVSVCWSPILTSEQVDWLSTKRGVSVVPERDAQHLTSQFLTTTSRNMAVAWTCELRTPLAVKVKANVKFTLEQATKA